MRNSIRVFLLVLASASAGFGQETKPQAVPQEKEPVFRQNVNLVSLFVNVKDKHGALVPKLTRDGFEVFEDGKPETIKYFSAETNQPLTLGILIDSSLSMKRMLGDEQVIAGNFVRQVITEKDLAFVISFDITVDLLQDLTSNAHLLRTGLEKAKVNVGSGAASGRPGLGQGPFPISNPKGTLLYDAIYLGSSDILSKQVGRKAIVILTDGVDQGSRTKLREAIEAAQKADVICYVLLMFDPEYGSDMHDMSQVAEQTGGRAISVGSKPEKLSKAFAEISDELRSQYSIGYTPVNSKHDGSFRRIEVKSKDGYKIQSRKGYYAPVDSE